MYAERSGIVTFERWFDEIVTTSLCCRALTESSHQLMMITGDAPLTACFAASKVHIVTREVLILTHRSDGGEGATTKVDNAAHDGARCGPVIVPWQCSTCTVVQ